jgi:hypothetical protein
MRRFPRIGKLGDPPAQRPVGDAAAGVVARRQVDAEVVVEPDRPRRMQLDLEARQAIGFLLELDRTAFRAADLEMRFVTAGRRRLLVEFVIGGAFRGELQVIGPLRSRAR